MSIMADIEKDANEIVLLEELAESAKATFRLFTAYVNAGFTDAQALDLIKAFLVTRE